MTKPADLLKELRIDREEQAPGASKRAVWLALGIAVAVLLIALGGWALIACKAATEVKTAQVVAIGGGSANASVLDATGYIVARRMATVSAKITGKVQEVLIEEGQKI